MPLRNVNPYIKHRVNEWADFFRDSHHVHLGYPRTSSARWLKDGRYLKMKRSQNSYLPVNEAAEEIERLLQDIAKKYPLSVKVLYWEYFKFGRREEKARCLEMSEGEFCGHLKVVFGGLEERLVMGS